MLERGVKEIRDHFTQYLKKVSAGEEVVVTERGKPVALLKPLPKGLNMQERLEMASIKGLIRLPKKKGGIPERRKIKLTGKPITNIILEERKGDKW